MAGVPPELSPVETQILIDYARQRFAEERWPMSPSLRAVREVLQKLSPNPAPLPPSTAKPPVRSLYSQRQKRRR